MALTPHRKSLSVFSGIASLNLSHTFLSNFELLANVPRFSLHEILDPTDGEHKNVQLELVKA